MTPNKQIPEFQFVIYNSMRYGECKRFPPRITCYNCSRRQAEELAEWMSSFYAGQEGMFLVQGYEDD